MPLPGLLFSLSRRRASPPPAVEDNFSLAGQIRQCRGQIRAQLRVLATLKLLSWREDLRRFAELNDGIDNLNTTDHRLCLTHQPATGEALRFGPLCAEEHRRIHDNASSIIAMSLQIQVVGGQGTQTEQAALAAGLLQPSAASAGHTSDQQAIRWLAEEHPPVLDDFRVLGGLPLSPDSQRAILDPHSHQGIRRELRPVLGALRSLKVLLASCISELEALRNHAARARQMLAILLHQNRDYRQIPDTPLPGVLLGGRPLIWLNHHYARALLLLLERPILDRSGRLMPYTARLLDVCRATRSLHRWPEVA